VAGRFSDSDDRRKNLNRQPYFSNGNYYNTGFDHYWGRATIDYDASNKHGHENHWLDNLEVRPFRNSDLKPCLYSGMPSEMIPDENTYKWRLSRYSQTRKTVSENRNNQKDIRCTRPNTEARIIFNRNEKDIPNSAKRHCSLINAL
jgi:hypothetical protein